MDMGGACEDAKEKMKLKDTYNKISFHAQMLATRTVE